MKLKKILLIIVICLVAIIAVAGIIFYPALKVFKTVETLQPDPQLTIVTGGGGNSGILVTNNAVVVIDTKMGGDAEDLYKKVVQIAGKKPVIVINTHDHGDHVKGNHFYAGSKIYMGNYDRAVLQKDVAPEDMPNLMVVDSAKLDLGDEVIKMYDLGQAHTFHDMIVFLENRRVLFTGDLVFNGINPFLKRESGANVEKWIKALEKIELLGPVKLVIPGHGKTGGMEMVASMRQYFQDMTSAAKDPARENEMKEKYRDWINLPMMTSPGATIDYIRGK